MANNDYPINSDPRYDQIDLAIEKMNVDTLLSDRAKGNPWKIDKPSKRVSNCPVTMWIYNISPRKHSVSTLPGMPKVLPPCPLGSKYGPPLPIKEITLDYAGMGDYKLKAVEVDDIDLAGAIVCPTCLGVGDGCKDTADLRRWGVFYSYNNPPSEAELAKAQERLSFTLSEFIKIADTLWEDPKKRWQVTGENGAVYRMAAKAKGGIQRPWCTLLADKEACPGCGYTNDIGAMVCSNGTCGIILDYKKAVKFRKITKEVYAEAVADGLVPGEGPHAPAEVSSSAK